MSVDVTYACEYDYTDRVCYGCYGCETGEDYCRGSVYEGLEITAVDVEKVVSTVVFTGLPVYPELLKFAHSLDLSDVSHYEIQGEPDYYGETVAVYLDDEEAIALLREKHSELRP